MCEIIVVEVVEKRRDESSKIPTEPKHRRCPDNRKKKAGKGIAFILTDSYHSNTWIAPAIRGFRNMGYLLNLSRLLK